MTRTHPRRIEPPICAICGTKSGRLTMCEGGHVCEDCAEKSRLGRDSTTRAIKAQQRSLRGKAREARSKLSGSDIDDQLDYDIAASGMLAADALQHRSVVTLLPGEEVLPQHDAQLVNTLAAPCAVSIDASAHRLDLITAMGTDVAAMALDASDTIQAQNSMEKMLAHQLATCHEAAMRYASKATLEADPVHAVRMMNLATRSMEIFQKGVITLKRLRGTGEQRIVIQHVNVTDGGQAVIGQVNPGGVDKK